MIDRAVIEAAFSQAKSYDQYLASDPARAPGWVDVWNRTTLDQSQQAMLGTFSRTMHVLVVSGMWCGDCVQQGPMLARIAAANPAIVMRWVDRDEAADFSARIKLCGGGRVPVVVFASEEFEACSIYGDRTLSRYRGLARRQLGASCELPWAQIPADESAMVLQEWLNEFERVQWMLRLSPKLRQKHGD